MCRAFVQPLAGCGGRGSRRTRRIGRNGDVQPPDRALRERSTASPAPPERRVAERERRDHFRRTGEHPGRLARQRTRHRRAAQRTWQADRRLTGSLPVWRQRRRRVRSCCGVPARCDSERRSAVGTAVWIAADELGLPLVGLARAPTGTRRRATSPPSRRISCSVRRPKRCDEGCGALEHPARQGSGQFLELAFRADQAGTHRRRIRHPIRIRPASIRRRRA